MNAVLLSEYVTWIKDLFKHECEDKGFFPVIILLVFIVGNVSLIMDISTGLAQGLRGSVTVKSTLDRTEIDDTAQSIFSLDQRYHLGWDSELSPFFTWRTDVRDQESLDDTEEGKTTGRDIELSSELILRNPLFDWSAGFRLTKDTFKAPEFTRETLFEQDIFSRFVWRPEGFPTLSLQYDKFKDYDDFRVRKRDTSEDRFQATLDYTYGPLSFVDDFIYKERRDHVLKITRKSLENLGRVNFEEDFWKGRIYLLGNYQLNYTSRQEIAEVVTTLEQLRLPRRGLYIPQDTTPEDGQLNDTPSLIDSNKSTPATDGLGNTINIGGGNTFRNIGIELIVPQVVNRILIYVRPGDPNLSPLIVWDAYFSDNGRNWSLIASTAFFNPAENRYEISFADTPHRFFKVVNSATSAVLDSFVTEIEAIGPVLVGAEKDRVSRDVIQDINSTVRFRPIEKATLSYDFLYNRTERKTDTDKFVELRNNHGITLQADPFRYLSAYVRYERSLTESDQDVETLNDLYYITLDSTPWETLTTTLSASHTQTAEDGENQFRSDSISLQVISQLHRDLNMSIDVGYSTREDFVAETTTTTLNWGVDLDAELRRDLTATLSYDGSREFQRPEDIRTPVDDVRLLIIWRPTRLLNLSGEWGYRSELGSGGFTHRYTLDWLPFPDGNIALDCFIEYELDRSGVENRQEQELRAGFRWAVNRNTDFRLTYTFDGSSNTSEESIQTLTTILDIRF
jgi:hypothetical protein